MTGRLGLRARGNVEDWLGKVEDSMFGSLRRRMHMAMKDHRRRSRKKWILSHPSQVSIPKFKVHAIFNLPTDQEKQDEMVEFENKNFDDLNKLAAMVRGDLEKLQRMVLCSLITVDVHARDIVTELVREKVTSEDNFEWLRQLRYYWDEEHNTCVARMSSATYIYGYEYLGASGKLVITPLTDKCYLCLMGALQLDLGNNLGNYKKDLMDLLAGGAPAGPAGTGKTETTKDLAKALAIQCVVFNCSEGLDYKMMGRFFSGLAQSGAWCCFDEFNRIDIEVLSVIAQQLITIRNAKAAKMQRYVSLANMYIQFTLKGISLTLTHYTMERSYKPPHGVINQEWSCDEDGKGKNTEENDGDEVWRKKTARETKKEIVETVNTKYESERFMFEGREIKLVQTCAAFITMNPGYAGRTELPDNLKALFRPISMMVPDYALIAEVILYSEGFESSKVLANKMVQMYKLCSEQLSQQDHYDFGMSLVHVYPRRAVKSVLVMAGSLKRENPDKSEEVVLIRALRDSNLPKFLVDDAGLFKGILNDLFPGVTIPEQDYGVLLEAIIAVMVQEKLQPEECMITKVIQLHETMIVRHGVMLVGPTGGGKTTVLNTLICCNIIFKVLKSALEKLHADKVKGPYYRPVHTYIMNPKSVTLGELYGEVNLFTLEWKDGLLGIMVRLAVQCTTDDHQWVICDGPVDAVWIENMNTVLDDNKTLCLANSERIKLTPYIHMVFEVQDLSQASPATVSRCGMVYIDSEEIKVGHSPRIVYINSEEIVIGQNPRIVYIDSEEIKVGHSPRIVYIDSEEIKVGHSPRIVHIDSEEIKVGHSPRIVYIDSEEIAIGQSPRIVYINSEKIKWLPYVQSWMARFRSDFPEELKKYILVLFEDYVEAGFHFIRRNCDFAINQVDVSKAAMLCSLLESLILLATENNMDWKGDTGRIKTFLCQAFVFSYIWSLGGNITDTSREMFEVFVRGQFEEHHDARLPSTGELWNLYLNIANKRLDVWDKIIPTFAYNVNVPFFEMLVPTTDTVRFGYILERLMSVNKPVLLTGLTGVPTTFKHMNPPPSDTGVGKSVIAKEVLMRLARGGSYIPVALNFSAQTTSSRTQEILEMKLEKKKRTLLGAPAGKKIILFVDDVNMPKLDTYGSQPPIELLRQYLDFHGLYDREKLFWKDIQDVIITAACAPPGGGRNPLTPRFVRHFAMLLISSPTEITLKVIFKDIGDSIVNASVEIYDRIAKDLLPTPAKSHYVFNLRDLSKCIQGVLQADSGTMREAQEMERLFYHECLRVFHDRLVNVEDKSYFYHLMKEVCTRAFGRPVLSFPPEPKVITSPPVLLFGDFMNTGAARQDRIYEEIRDTEKLRHVMQDYLEDYNMMTSKEMKLIFFMDAMEHTTRLARILRSERSNGLLVGVGGMGKQSLTRLGAHLCGYNPSLLFLFRCFQIELTRAYDHSAFHEDLRKLYFNAGAKNEDTTFLFTDTQIVQEEFLEDINNILNSGESPLLNLLGNEKGEVPNLFESDEYEKVVNSLRPSAKEVGIAESNRDAIFDYFISRVRSKLHLVICMSPVGDAFSNHCRRRCRMFPSLVNCCTIDWFVEWPQEALLSVAENSLKVVGGSEVIKKLARICVTIHESVSKMTVRFYEEMRRHYYTTPSSYLELLKLYLEKLSLRKEKVTKKKDRISNGLQEVALCVPYCPLISTNRMKPRSGDWAVTINFLKEAAIPSLANGSNKLYETYAVVDTMKESMTALEPQLQKQSADTARLMKHLVKEQAQADKVRQVVVTDEAVVKVKAEETQFIADDAQRDLDAALPAMEAATKALEALNKNDINELKVFNKPPPLVKFVMESVCLLLGTNRSLNCFELECTCVIIPLRTDWPTAKTVLGDTNFLKKLQDYEKDKISEAMLKKLKEYVDHPDFIPDKVATQSKVCKSICMWVRAIDCYAKVFRVVQPKRKRYQYRHSLTCPLNLCLFMLEQAERELTEVMAVLREKQQKLAEVEKQIAELEASYDRSVAAKKELEDNLELTANRLVRAGRLTSALEDEQVLWEKSVKELSQDMVTMMGDVLVAAASVAYLGAFTSNYRDDLISLWLLINILADQFEIREWNTYGLPRDNVSTENGILVMHAGRWPLMIDPQEQARICISFSRQANRWIRQMEAKDALNIVKLTDGNLMRILERSIRLGLPVLLEEVGEFLDPTLRPVLLKQTFTQGGRLLIRLGDSDVDYDDKFRLYLTTKLSNPHYLPEICIQVTIVNFTVTPSGLEDQLLSDVVRLERPDLEKQRSELIMRINNDKNQLENIEDKILRMLFASEGNILDNEELIDTLNESKRINHPKHCKDIISTCSQETAAIIEDRLIEAEATEENISIAREKYRVVATRGSVLYFVVAELGNIDPMYQYSLKYFSQVRHELGRPARFDLGIFAPLSFIRYVFNMVIETTEKSPDLEVRLSTLIQEITLSMYTNVSRGLFERHKLVFSFMVCANILKHSGDIKEAQWNFLLRGPITTKQSLLKKPDVPALSDATWLAVCYLNNNFKSFQGLAGDAVDKILVSIGDFEQLIDLSPSTSKQSSINWNKDLSDFEKLMLLKALKEEKARLFIL
uniref:Dynein heavy chain n=1 Tax=Timema genevievae TaxID=629358 RepID=A0A7R9PIT8_TIMGE|nr:unnamed protein product [Timema genevievae]